VIRGSGGVQPSGALPLGNNDANGLKTKSKVQAAERVSWLIPINRTE
jgi:hypothetical protein